MISFEYTIFAWAFTLIGFFVLLFILNLLWKKKVRRKMGDKQLIAQLTKGFSSPLFFLKFLLLTLAFAAGVVAVMHPRVPGAPDNINRKGIDLVIALDVSNSMRATDLAPTRLDRAKQFLNKLIATMPDDRIGLVLFAGRAYLQMPLTLDHGSARMYISSSSPEAVPQQGTNLNEAMKMASATFNSKEKRFKALLIISDGEDHDEESVNTASDLAEQGVMINTIGVGSPEGTTIPDPETGELKVDDAGNVVISRLNENTLNQISQVTNGVYIKLEGSDDAVDVLKKQLSQIEARAFTDVSLINYRSLYMWLALALLILLTAETFIPETTKKAFA